MAMRPLSLRPAGVRSPRARTHRASFGPLRRLAALVLLPLLAAFLPQPLGAQVAAQEAVRALPEAAMVFDVLRDGDRQTLDVTIGTMPGAKQQAARAMEGSDETSLADLGLRVAPSEDGEGVSIVGLDPDGPAAGKGIRPGDQIVEVAGATVKTPEELNAALEKAGEGDRKSVLVLVRTSDGQRFVALPLKQG